MGVPKIVLGLSRGNLRGRIATWCVWGIWPRRVAIVTSLVSTDFSGSCTKVVDLQKMHQWLFKLFFIHPIYTWNPNDPCFDWKRPCFGGLTFKNRGHLGSRYIYIYDGRSKVLYSNFNLGGPQPTHLYDFSISLCGVTQGNHAKHKLGARFAQGWRKCFHACLDYLHIYTVYIIYCLVCI